MSSMAALPALESVPVDFLPIVLGRLLVPRDLWPSIICKQLDPGVPTSRCMRWIEADAAVLGNDSQESLLFSPLEAALSSRDMLDTVVPAVPGGG